MTSRQAISAQATLLKQRIIELRRKNPCWLVAQIASECGVSNQWVSYVLAQARMPVRHVPLRFRCSQCGAPRGVQARFDPCPKCRAGNNIITLQCDECGNLFQRYAGYASRGIVKNGQKLFFCNRRCFGRYAGTHYGIGRRAVIDEK